MLLVALQTQFYLKFCFLADASNEVTTTVEVEVSGGVRVVYSPSITGSEEKKVSCIFFRYSPLHSILLLPFCLFPEIFCETRGIRF